MPALILMFASIPLATLLLALGLRGRRIDDHPVCAHCHFDLLGLVAAAGAPAGKPGAACPECGHDLGARGAIRIGQRVRRRGLIAAGILGLLLAAAIGIGSAIAARNGITWNTYKPAWWLVINARDADSTIAQRALAELASRVKSDRLSASRRDSLVQEALQRQADPADTWYPGWGDIIEFARANNHLADDRWDAYLRHTVDVHVTARATVQAGSHIPVEIGPILRTGSVGTMAARFVLTDLRLGGRPIGPNEGTFILDAALNQFSTFTAAPGKPAWLHPMVNLDQSAEAESRLHNRIEAPEEPGDYTLEATFVVQVAASTGTVGGSGLSMWVNWKWAPDSQSGPAIAAPATPADPGSRSDNDRVTDPDAMARRILSGDAISSTSPTATLLAPGPPDAAWKVTCRVPISVVAGDAPTVGLVNNPALLDAVKRGMHVEVYDRSARLPYSPIACRLNSMAIPFAVAFDVFVVGPPQRGGVERRLGALAAPAGQSGGGSEWGLEKQEAQSDGTYQLVLRPSPKAAARTRTITSIWGGEVWIRGLKVGMDHSAAGWYVYPSIADHEAAMQKQAAPPRPSGSGDTP